MDADESEHNDSDSNHKRDGYFQKSKNWFKVRCPKLYESIEREIHNARFLVEVLGLLGLLAYVTIAAGQWNATIKVMRADQRAWIIPAAKLIHVELNAPIGQGLVIQNTGRTPAKKFYVAFYLIQNDGTSIDFDYSRPNAAKANGNVIFPNVGPFASELPLLHGRTGERVIADQKLINAYVSGKIFFASYGRITYDDIFGTSHWINFCNFSVAPNIAGGLVGNPPPAAQKCADYNDIDKN